MAFHNVRLPTDISYLSTGGPTRMTEVAILGSGFENRNTPWQDSRHEYNAGYGLRKRDGLDSTNLYKIKAFFELRMGKLHSFPFKDWQDYKSCGPLTAITSADQSLGTGDGATKNFEIWKTYSDAAAEYRRRIYLPRLTTLLVAVDGVDVVQTVDYTIASATGIVAFVTAPTNGAVLTCGFEFDVPVRFDTDKLVINMSAWEAGEIPDIPLIEVKL